MFVLLLVYVFIVCCFVVVSLFYKLLCLLLCFIGCVGSLGSTCRQVDSYWGLATGVCAHASMKGGMGA